MTNIKYYSLQRFISESNHIEGEDHISPDVEALEKFLANDLTEENLHEYHRVVSWNQDRSGKWRTCNVRVGNHIPPTWLEIWKRLYWFFEKLSDMDAREAHNEFEQIHPYQDFNGRMWRAIRLHKMQDTYNPKLGFLHSYYYQTLQHI